MDIERPTLNIKQITRPLSGATKPSKNVALRLIVLNSVLSTVCIEQTFSLNWAPKSQIFWVVRVIFCGVGGQPYFNLITCIYFVNNNLCFHLK